MIERSDGAASMAEGLNLFGISPQSGNDQKILENFIQSPDMLDYLEQQLWLKRHYSQHADWISRLSPNATYDDFLAFYREHISIRYNDNNGLLELSVQGFEPSFTHRIAKRYLNAVKLSSTKSVTIWQPNNRILFREKSA